MPPLSVDQLGPDGAGAGVSVNRPMPNGKLGPTKSGLACLVISSETHRDDAHRGIDSSFTIMRPGG